MSLVSSQAQLTLIASNDSYLTKDAKLPLFRQNYKTYTPLASTYHFHRPEGDVSGVSGETVRFSLRRTGDLLSKVFLRFRGSILNNSVFPDSVRNTFLGSSSTASDDMRYKHVWGPLSYYAIDSVTLKLNSTTVDTLYGDWMYVWTEFLTPTKNDMNSKNMTTKMSTPDNSMTNCDSEYFFLPIPFWFSQNPSLALPLVALANTEIEFVVKFAKTVQNKNLIDTYVTGNSGTTVKTDDALNQSALSTIELVTEEITLCESERKWFATNPVSYLITQHNQRDTKPYSLTKTVENSDPNYVPSSSTSGVTDPDTIFTLDNFRLPVKQLWVGKGGLNCRTTAGAAPSESTFFTDDRLVSGAFFLESWLMNDSRDLTEKATPKTRTSIPSYQDGVHTGISSSIKKQFLTIAGQDSSSTESVMTYQPSLISFSMGLDDVHPEGAINFSRLKSPRLVLKGTKLEPFPSGLSGTYDEVEGNYVIMAENYNILDLKNGTAYLRFTD